MSSVLAVLRDHAFLTTHKRIAMFLFYYIFVDFTPTIYDARIHRNSSQQILPNFHFE